MKNIRLMMKISWIDVPSDGLNSYRLPFRELKVLF